MFNICIAQIGIWIWSNALDNSRGNQINIAQITILQLLFTNQIKSSVGFLMRGENRSTQQKKLSWQSREPTNSIHIWHQVWESNRGHIGGRQVLSPLGQPCHQLWLLKSFVFYWVSKVFWNGQAKAYVWVWQVCREKEVKKCVFFIFQLCYISVVLSQDLVLLWLQQLKHILLICCKLLCNLKVPCITLFLPFSVLCTVIFWVKMHFFLIVVCTFFTA